MLSIFIWLTPLFILISAFFTSKINEHRLYRYTLYVLILFTAFLLDLQATSFINDRMDIIFNRIVLFIIADFFFRWARRKSKILRSSGIIIGVILFLWGYRDWIVTRPAALVFKWNAPIIVTSEKKGTTYHIKARTLQNKTEDASQLYVLYKRRLWHILEQECSTFEIPEGYEKANFSYKWQVSNNGNVEVKIIGDSDTLWTLSGNTTPQ